MEEHLQNPSIGTVSEEGCKERVRAMESTVLVQELDQNIDFTYCSPTAKSTVPLFCVSNKILCIRLEFTFASTLAYCVQMYLEDQAFQQYVDELQTIYERLVDTASMDPMRDALPCTEMPPGSGAQQSQDR